MNRVTRVDEDVRVRRVLISVSDKTDLETLVSGLLAVDGLIIYSTGGTYAHIAAMLGDGARDRLRQVSDYTGQPEMQGGLVKTLDYRIYLGLLSEPYNDAHDRDRERAGADLIDMVVVNLYPFRSVISQSRADAEDARTNIDIGGPCMLRAAAKSFLRVAAVCDRTDYRPVVEEISRNGGATSLATRYRLAQKAFCHTAEYDRAIADFLSAQSPADAVAAYEVSS
jgi:phosphoribosylaminoimidazolecarboxamide formyltransferase / IMP cyclohydrolase